MLRQLLTLLALLTGLAAIAPGQEARAAERQASGIEAPAPSLETPACAENSQFAVLTEYRPACSAQPVIAFHSLSVAPQTVWMRIDRARE